MRFQRLRRAILAATCLSSLLVACGGGESVVSQFNPTRVVAFGDAFSDAGQRGAQYTINDATRVNWTQQLAARYGLIVGPSSGGGTNYAYGSARVTAKPDAAGDASTPSIAEQVGTFLTTGQPQDKDIVLVSGGVSDILAEVAAFDAGTQDAATTTSHVAQAGRDLGAQVRRLVGAGATHVLVAGAYNLGRSPWAVATGHSPFAESLVGAFNDALLVSIVDLGSRTLFIDTALFYNLVTANPAAYSLVDVISVICTSVDPGPGIGIGAGQVNSSQCTGSTLQPGLAPGATLFADPVYFTPVGQALFGNYAADRLRARF
ncbi:SGNH/GDSL hydrolase family protein [Ramlibacter sp. MMS24-I3-19]|uniref:SGNH/GDSL hydrolase family protein n=1 Tax=Ramlibacter sp. MMS24-I3-19 TaxID=3416606 RepID=UPI003D08999C